MGIAQRASFPWLMVVIFLCFLDLRLEDKINWSWYIVFLPLYLYDCVAFIYLGFKIIKHYRNGYDHGDLTIKRKAMYVLAVFLKLIFQIMICTKLEHFPWLPVYFVALPVLVLLLGSALDVLKSLVNMAQTT